MKSILAFNLFFLTTIGGNAQEAIGTNNPDPSSAVDITSTTKGILIPRMTSAERTAISGPAEGLRVYDTDTKGFWFFDGTVWVAEANTGNSGQSPWDNPDGSVADQSSTDITYIDGNVAIGSESASSRLFVSNGIIQTYNTEADGNIWGVNINRKINNTVNATPGLQFQKFSGTEWPDRAAVTAGTTIGSLGYAGAGGAENNISPNAAIISKAQENFSLSSKPASLEFLTTASGSTSLLERMRINPDGNVGIGTSTPLEKLQIGDQMAIHDGGWKSFGFNRNWVPGVGWQHINDGPTAAMTFVSTTGELNLLADVTNTAGSAANVNFGSVPTAFSLRPATGDILMRAEKAFSINPGRLFQNMTLSDTYLPEPSGNYFGANFNINTGTTTGSLTGLIGTNGNVWKNGSSTAANAQGGFFRARELATNTGDVNYYRGVVGTVEKYGSGNNLNDALGVYGTVSMVNGSSGQMRFPRGGYFTVGFADGSNVTIDGDVRGFEALANISSASSAPLINQVYGGLIQVSSFGANVNNHQPVTNSEVLRLTQGTGFETQNNMFGLRITNINGGAVNNYAIYTDAGKVRLGDITDQNNAADKIVVRSADGVLHQMAKTDLAADTNNNPWDNPDGSVADQSSTTINYLGGNVGIGTATPEQPLEVGGSVMINDPADGIVLLHGDENDALFQISGGRSTDANRPVINLWGSQSGGGNAGMLQLQSEQEMELISSDAIELRSNNGAIGTYLYADGTTGHVGVGTTTPTRSLEVDGVGILNRGAAPLIQYTESDNSDKNWFTVVDNGTFSLREDDTATQRMTVLEGGDVGIGTIVPTQRLTVESPDFQVARLTRNSVDSGKGAILTFEDSDGDEWRTGPTTTNNATLNRYQIRGPSGYRSFTIEDGTQRVGVGINVPVSKLHVNDSISLGTTLSDEKSIARFSGTADANKLTLEVKNIRTEAGQSSWVGSKTRLEYRVDNSTNKKIWMDFVNPTGGATTNNAIAFGEGASEEWMRIKDGLVGIGTTDPTAPLDIEDVARMGSTATIFGNPSQNYTLRRGVDNEVLTVSGGTSTSDGGNIRFFGQNHPTSPSEVQFRQDGVDIMRFRNNNVGIGTNNPNDKLTVRGAVNTSWYLAANTDQNQTTTVLPAQGGYLSWNEDNGGHTHFSNHRGGGNGGWKFDAYNADGSFDATRMFLRGDNGNLGLGTAAPSANIHVVDPNDGVNMRLEASGTDTWSSIQMISTRNVLNEKWWDINNRGDNGNLSFRTRDDDGNNGQIRMSLTRNGELGIGTSSPQEKLSIAGNGATNTRVTSHGGKPTLQLYRTSGGQATPTPVVDGDILGEISFGGLTSAGTQTRDAYIQAEVNGPENANGSSPTDMKFKVTDITGNNQTAIHIKQNAFVGFGIGDPQYRIDVNGDVNVNGNFRKNGVQIPDYVFEKYYDGYSTLKSDYSMLPLLELEAYLKKNKHLPGVMSAAEVAEEGGVFIDKISLSNLEKVEELFLHTIAQEKTITALKEEVAGAKEDAQKSKTELEDLKDELVAIKALLAQIVAEENDSKK